MLISDDKGGNPFSLLWGIINLWLIGTYVIRKHIHMKKRMSVSTFHRDIKISKKIKFGEKNYNMI